MEAPTADSTAASPSHADDADAEDLVDPRAPRFGQSITALATGAFVAMGHPAPLFAVAGILALSVLSGWRVDLYGILWRHAAIPLLGPPHRREPAAPHRFAKLLGATFTVAACGLFVAELVLPATAVAGMVALLAGLAAVLDVCVGCRMYREVAFVRRLGVV